SPLSGTRQPRACSVGFSMLNYALYQVGWFACILGAAWGWPVAGAAVAVALIGVHVVVSGTQWRAEVALAGVALALGLVVEGFQVKSGTYAQFTSGVVLAWMSPPWLLVMWAQFATVCRWSLKGVMLVPWRAVLFGALGGPIAFWAGERLGAVDLARPLSEGFLRLAMSWAIALGALSFVARRLNRTRASQ
ncbi:MAG: DUF2878 domain-containing protein, partial [Gemmatimonadaceae bacterium]